MEGCLTSNPQQHNADHVPVHDPGDLRVKPLDLQDHSDLQGSFDLTFEQNGLTSRKKSILSQLYRLGRKKTLISSHIKFLAICKQKDLIPLGLEIPKADMENDVVEKVIEVEKLQVISKMKKFEEELKSKQN